MSQRTTTSPMKITLEMHSNVFTWEGPWDSDFDSLMNVFIGLCSAGGFADKTHLKRHIHDIVEEEILSEEEYEQRKKDNPILFQE